MGVILCCIQGTQQFLLAIYIHTNNRNAATVVWCWYHQFVEFLANAITPYTNHAGKSCFQGNASFNCYPFIERVMANQDILKFLCLAIVIEFLLGVQVFPPELSNPTGNTYLHVDNLYYSANWYNKSTSKVSWSIHYWYDSNLTQRCHGGGGGAGQGMWWGWGGGGVCYWCAKIPQCGYMVYGARIKKYCVLY